MARSTQFLQTAHAKETFGPLGIEPAGGSPEELKDFIAAEIAKWAPIVKAANLEF
jgi:tripartite-type tricarboxylate transporter receptor subunit TctC